MIKIPKITPPRVVKEKIVTPTKIKAQDSDIKARLDTQDIKQEVKKENIQNIKDYYYDIVYYQYKLLEERFNFNNMCKKYEAIYNSVFGPLTRFNNTVVMGSFVFGLILFFPIYFGMKKFVVMYRERLEEKIKKWKIVQMISGSKIFQLYEKIRDLGGN